MFQLRCSVFGMGIWSFCVCEVNVNVLKMINVCMKENRKKIYIYPAKLANSWTNHVRIPTKVAKILFS